MSRLTEHIGERIRLYRKNQRMSMEELAARISKSKPTVSKYENGAIAIDIDTLFEIASALNITVNQLMDYSPRTQSAAPGSSIRGVFNNNILYLYYFDGRVNRLARGFMQLFGEKGADGIETTLYMDVDSFSHYTKCNILYYGSIVSHDMITNMSFENQANRTEQIHIIALNPLKQDDIVRALICGISYHPIMPVAFRCIISPKPMPEDDSLLEQLVLSREDVKFIKKYNYLSVQRFEY